MDLDRRAVAPAMGIAFFLLAMVATLPFEPRGGVEPSAATETNLRAYYEENAARTRIYTVLTTAGWAAFIWFVAGLHVAVGRYDPSSGPATVGLGVSVALLQCLAVIGPGALAFTAVDELPAGVLLPWHISAAILGNLLVELATFTRGLFLLAVGWAALRSHGLPSWLAWTAVALGAAAVIAGAGLLSPATKSLASVPGLASHLLFYVWALAAALVLLFRPQRSREAPSS